MSEELAQLLASGERAALHGRPADGIGPLQRAVELAHGSGREAEATAAAWLLGVCLGARGMYGSALSVLEPLARAEPSTPERMLFTSLGSSTLASLARQLGRHSDARSWDELALERAGGAPEASFDAQLGLAADAVGLGDAAEATARLASASALAVQHEEWWRQRVRLGWVHAEVALLTGSPGDAVTSATRAVAAAERAGAPRHVAKGLLFTGVALVSCGSLDEAATTLRRAAGLAESLGATPVVWPARAVLGALLQVDSPEESARALRSARDVVRGIAADLPEAYATDWLARPDIAALLHDS